MKITFLEEAKLEFLDAISYYESEQPGLGLRFKEIEVCFGPEVCRLRAPGYRRINLRVFPYYVPYVVRETTLWVLAIAHHRRRPEYWIKRRTPSD